MVPLLILSFCFNAGKIDNILTLILSFSPLPKTGRMAFSPDFGQFPCSRHVLDQGERIRYMCGGQEDRAKKSRVIVGTNYLMTEAFQMFKKDSNQIKHS